MFKLHIETGNAAFEGQPTAEIARILRSLASKLETEVDGSGAGVLHDHNGNRVGTWDFDAGEDSSSPLQFLEEA